TPGTPATTAEPLTEIKVVERVTAACDKALAYLASKQRPDGAWHDNNAVNGLALLAFMGRGHVPGRGPYKDVLERGKKFILAKQQPTGFLGFGTMYEHGLATLALAEMYGNDPDPALENGLRKAVDLIVKCQSPRGGWRYSPAPVDQDLSVTVMQIVALRAANNAEVPVPKATIDKAIQYVHSCAAPAPGGGFGYAGPGSGPQTSAAGTLSLQLLGQPDDPAVKRALDYVATVKVAWQGSGANYFYYFHYYAIQANYQAGGKYWNDWHPRVRELLLAHQHPDGSWDVPPGTAEQAGTVGPNKVYWTAMGSLVLDIYMHFLPAYQR
ncbi:MAG TPA: prenyltransferase/squalene oxidase repeat-containing protein, partial [Gemmataceae bacterium]|nr:prenyltransferase/squalene oxidase repeat-containing protein [Gemmataceae bacterium]